MQIRESTVTRSISFTFNFNSHRFIAEESADNNQALTESPTWIIDPIDGTNNYCQRIPFVAISIAFVWKREICIGIVYNPVLREFYSARLGCGSFMNGKRIQCSQIEAIEEATLGHEVSFIRLEKYRDRNVKLVKAFASASKGFRSFGTCALSLAFVARGCLDGYQVSELFPWDIAAGVLLVREAGGSCYKPDGTPIDLDDPRFICGATENLCQEMIRLNKEALEA